MGIPDATDLVLEMNDDLIKFSDPILSTDHRFVKDYVKNASCIHLISLKLKPLPADPFPDDQVHYNNDPIHDNVHGNILERENEI